MIELVSGSKRFGDNAVFKRVNLALETRTYYTLTGPNGSGKSTLMSCLLGQELLTEGEILLSGTDISKKRQAYAQEVFGINDSIGWLPGLTVGQHLDMLLQNSAHLDNPLGTPLCDSREALENLSIPQAYNREPYTLSSGQEQRARLASLLIRPARYYFLDEPEKRLDRQGIEWIAAWAQARVAEGAMVCIATHEPALNAVPHTVNITFPLDTEAAEDWDSAS